MIISISGAAGSGKSTVARLLAEKLGMPSYYIGGLRREMAQKKGMTLEEYNAYGETHPETDKEVDEYQRELGKTQDDFIIQGRTSFYFIPHSIKIYLDVDMDEGTRRIWQDLQNNPERQNEANLHTEDEVKKSLIKRKASDVTRYKNYYNIDAYDTKHYDMVIDTTHLTAQEVTEKILSNPLLTKKTP